MIIGKNILPNDVLHLFITQNIKNIRETESRDYWVIEFNNDKIRFKKENLPKVICEIIRSLNNHVFRLIKDKNLYELASLYLLYPINV